MKINIQETKRYSSLAIRYSIAIVYFWFGVLKPLGLSPAEDLVTSTLFFIPPQAALYAIGFWEIAIGALMLKRKTVKYGLLLLFLHLPGILSPIVFMPDLIFQQFPHVLTLEGQYVFKNLITAGAALKLVSEELERNPELKSYFEEFIE
jgi:uncharacterized membrane protein YkgB